MKVTKKGSVTSFQFEDKKELDCWANKNITNPKVRDAVLAPVSIRGKLKKNIKYKKHKTDKGGLDMNPIASLALCNTASLNIYGFESGIEDYVIAGMNDKTPRKYKIYYTTKGGYFNWGGCRYYLSEFTLV